MARPTHQFIGWLLTVSAPMWLFPLAWSMGFSSNPVLGQIGLFLLQLHLVAVFGLFIAIVVLFVGLFQLCHRQRQQQGLRNASLSAVFLCCLPLGVVLGESVRHANLTRVAERSQPLAAAITAYEAKHGQPPQSLDELVPEYIDAIPSTGVGTFPNYHYHTDREGKFNGNNWMLMAGQPGIVMGFDDFHYYPRQNYKEAGFTPIGNWGFRRD